MCVCVCVSGRGGEIGNIHWDDDAETKSVDVQPWLRPAAQEEHRQQSARWRAANTLPSVIGADRGSVAYTAATKRPGVYGELEMKERSVGVGGGGGGGADLHLQQRGSRRGIFLPLATSQQCEIKRQGGMRGEGA